MATLQFYKNKYRYPHYSNTLTAYGTSMECTPVGVNLKGGSLRVKGTMTDFMSCNYLALTRDNQTVYAWIEDVKFRTEDSFEVAYSVDAWRTYKSKIDLGTQYIARSPVATYLKDNLLGSVKPYMSIDSMMYSPAFSTSRVMVVQVRGAADSLFSNTPVQPTPYQFYLIRYQVNNWQATAPLLNLISTLASSAKTINIVTMYSIPYMDLTGIPTQVLPVDNGNSIIEISGFQCLDGTTATNTKLFLETPIIIDNPMELMKTEHSVSIVIPEAGIIHIPDELLNHEGLKLRQDIDLFSGASNYMLMTGDYVCWDHSVRGSSISSIPIISDPVDTYMSQNQNALATSLIGDVASIAMGAGLIASTGGMGAALGGAGSITGGLNGLMNTAANLGDMKTKGYSNPPAFLGTAMANNYNQMFWVITRRSFVDNMSDVNTYFGYPYNMIDQLSFPATGYIKTEGCSVMSTDGSVPKWALDEINGNFNRGILVH
jgi:hypothetical protein